MSVDSSIFHRVLSYVKDLTLAVDVGAHKGAWTDKMYMNFKSVYCFEPNMYLSNSLAEFYKGQSITVHNVALLDFVGKGKLCYDTGNEHKTRTHFVVEDDDGDVDISTLDSYKPIGCGLLKIDVEGGELPVLRGARRVLRHQKPVVIVECKSFSIRYGWNRTDLIMHMLELGYNTLFVENPNIVFVHSQRF